MAGRKNAPSGPMALVGRLRRLFRERSPYYWRTRRAAVEDGVSAVFGRYLRSPVSKRLHARTVEGFLREKRRYPLDAAALVDLDHIRQTHSRRFAGTEQALAFHRARWAEGEAVSTHLLFDAAHYARAADVPADIAPLDHYLANRPDVSPSPLFDVDFYHETYPDVRGANLTAFEHFFRYGRGELRQPHPLFSMRDFALSYGRLLDVDEDPLSSYIRRHRTTQGMRPHPLIAPRFVRKQVVALGLRPLTAEPPFGEAIALYEAHEADGVWPHPLFDPTFYRQAIARLGTSSETGDETGDPARARRPGDPELARREGEPLLVHFLRTVPRHATTDPSAAFSARAYLKQHRDTAGQNPLLHYELYGRKEGRTVVVPGLSSDDENISVVYELEPTLFGVGQKPDVEELWSTIEPRPHRAGVKLIEGLRHEIGSFRPTHVFLLSGFRRGGAERYAIKLLQAVVAAQDDAKVLVIGTDLVADEAADWLSPHERIKVASLSHEEELPRDIALVLLARFLEVLRAEWVVNTNSALGWEVYREFGRPLSRVSRLAATLFCYDYDVHGRKVGYARDYVRDTIEHLDLVTVDNARFKRELAHDFSLSRASRSKVQVLHQLFGPDDGSPDEGGPARDAWPDLAANAASSKDGPRILWPMRMHRQKRPDVLRRLALAMPDIRFDVWVPGAKWNSELAGGSKPANVRLVPDTGGTFAALDLKATLAMLSTAQWEGLPTIVLEAVAHGLPIIASDVGGVAEALPRLDDGETGYLVSPADDVDAYVAAIRALIADPQEAARRRERAFDHVRAQHGRDAYRARLEELQVIGYQPHERNTAAVPRAARGAGSARGARGALDDEVEAKRKPRKRTKAQSTSKTGKRPARKAAGKSPGKPARATTAGAGSTVATKRPARARKPSAKTPVGKTPGGKTSTGKTPAAKPKTPPKERPDA